MTRKILGVALIVLTAHVPGAEARTTIVEPEHSPYPFQQWADEAKVPTPTATLSVRIAPCPVIHPPAEGCFEDPLIWIRDSRADAATLYHELGHAFDRYVMTEEDRNVYKHVVRMTALPWGNSLEGAGVWKAGLGELFAQTYERCALQYRIRRARLVAPLWLTPPLHDQLCRLIRYWGEGQ